MDRYAFEGRFTRVTPIGLCASGLRMNIDFIGTLTEGPLSGATISGTDALLIRHDGVGQIDVSEVITRGDRVVASLRFLGYVTPPFELPDLPALLAPDFAWPDADLPMHGASFFDVAHDEAAQATATVFGVVGSTNLAAGTLRASAASLATTSVTIVAAADGVSPQQSQQRG